MSLLLKDVMAMPLITVKHSVASTESQPSQHKIEDGASRVEKTDGNNGKCLKGSS